eukprot:TRINITY_DN2280_c0_g3_i1.p1 TRINITY_DN2280_c0_g3~~TRINITY_DN2280_c0_g3_i1.p1  ORF type:complete len:153 (-),score=1.60 TRINITY_DN2280_c0_g3_i1:182-640(-)
MVENQSPVFWKHQVRSPPLIWVRYYIITNRYMQTRLQRRYCNIKRNKEVRDNSFAVVGVESDRSEWSCLSRHCNQKKPFAQKHQIRFPYSITLGYNKIGDKGAIAIAKALRENDSLESIYLSNNQIGNDGATELAVSLKKHETMRKVILGKC